MQQTSKGNKPNSMWRYSPIRPPSTASTAKEEVEAFLGQEDVVPARLETTKMARRVLLSLSLASLLGAILLSVYIIHGRGVAIGSSARDWLAGRQRPFFIQVNEFFNYDMPLNQSTECEIPVAIIQDAMAADLFIQNVYAEEAGEVDHAVKHWQPTVLYDIEENPVPAFTETRRNQTLGLPSFYDFRWTYELDAPLTYTYYQVTHFKNLRETPIPWTQKMDVPLVDFSSNCDSPRSDRYAITGELHRLLPGQIHSYGACHHNREMENDAPALERVSSDRGSDEWQERKFSVLRRSKMVLAFENANAVDYVTEKLWHAFAAGAVPIYMGAPNLRENFLPHPKAAIVASDFHTVQDLATHLEYVAGNETAYNEYLEWKTLPYSANFQALVDYEDSSSPLCKLAMYSRGLYTNPLNRFRTRERYGNVTVHQPLIAEARP